MPKIIEPHFAALKCLRFKCYIRSAYKIGNLKYLKKAKIC